MKEFAFGDRGARFPRVDFLVCFLRFLFAVATSRADLIYAINPIAGFASAFAPCRKLFVYESQEIFVGMSGRHSIGWRKLVWYWVERFVFAFADVSVFPDEFRRNVARRLYRLNGKCLTTMYNVSPHAGRGPLVGASKRRNQISYCGGMQRSRGILNIVRAFAQTNARREGVKLVLAGGGPADFIEEVQQTIRACGIEASVELKGQMTNAELLEEMAASQATLALYEGDSLNNRLCSPNKVFDAIAAGVILVATTAPLTRKLAKAGYGIVLVDGFEDRDLAEAIDRALAVEAPRAALPGFTPETEWRKVSECIHREAATREAWR